MPSRAPCVILGWSGTAPGHRRDSSESRMTSILIVIATALSAWFALGLGVARVFGRVAAAGEHEYQLDQLRFDLSGPAGRLDDLR